MGLAHAGYIRVEIIALGFTGKFLDDDGHGLFLVLAGGDPGKRQGVLVIGGRVNQLHGHDHPLQTTFQTGI